LFFLSLLFLSLPLFLFYFLFLSLFIFFNFLFLVWYWFFYRLSYWGGREGWFLVLFNIVFQLINLNIISWIWKILSKLRWHKSLILQKIAACKIKLIWVLLSKWNIFHIPYSKLFIFWRKIKILWLNAILFTKIRNIRSNSIINFRLRIYRLRLNTINIAVLLIKLWWINCGRNWKDIILRKSISIWIHNWLWIYLIILHIFEIGKQFL